LIFLAADYDSVSRLKDHVRSYLAWRRIVADYKDNRIVLDNLMAKQANASLEQAEETVRRMIRETYKWIVAPMQEARPGKGLSALRWEHFQINPGAQNWSQEVERVLKENELLINEWAPVHLAKVLKDWFWKDDAKETSVLNVWQQSCQQLYMPRLKDDTVFQMTMAAGADSRDFFGFAQGKEDGRYVGFSYGRRTSLIMDSSLLLIEPFAAAAYMEVLRAAEEASRAKAADTGGAHPPRQRPPGVAATHPASKTRQGGYPSGTGSAGQTLTKQFYGSIELDPILAKKQFADLVDEVASVHHAHRRKGHDRHRDSGRIGRRLRRRAAARGEGELQRAEVQERRVRDRRMSPPKVSSVTRVKTNLASWSTSRGACGRTV